MILSLKTGKLKVGMFVDLSESWTDSPFWKNRLEIKTEKQIDEIIKAGIVNVNVDTIKSRIVVDDSDNSKLNILKKRSGENKDKTREGKTACRDNEHAAAPAKWEPEKFMPVGIVQAFENKNSSPETRAKAVTNYSIEIMRNLLQNPTEEAIKVSKKGIAKVVDAILNEDETAVGLTKIVSHDFYTYTHSVSVGVKSVLLAKAIYKGSAEHDMHELGAGFFLHDLGKVNIDPAIINKPGKLTDEEFQIMKTHPYQGYKILNETKQLSNEIWTIVMQHHERDDGNGYPRKLSGDEIHPYARICCITDVYDALTAQRSYKKANPPLEALRIMRDEMASHFNKDLIKQFISLFVSSNKTKREPANV